MDFIQRLALILLLSIGAFFPNSAHADYAKTVSRYKLNIYNTYYPTHTEACADFVAAKRSAYPNENITLTSCTEAQVQAQGYSAGYTYYSSAITKYGTCNGVESLWGTGVCTGSCVAPETLQPNGTCAVPPPPPCIAGEVVYDQNTKKSFSNKIECWDSCEVYSTGTEAPFLDCSYGGTGVGYCYYLYHTVFKKTGNSCGAASGTPPESETPTPDTCEQCNCFESGGSWGSVNGINTCVPQGSPNSAPVQTTPPPVEITSTPPPTSENPNPTPVTTENQPPVIVITPSSGSSGEPNVTETTTNADGSITTTTQTKGQYCAENPNAELCNGDGTGSKNSFGGSCLDDGSADISCDGDAIQCAIAKQAKESHCKFFQADQALTDKYNEAKNDNGATNPTNTANISSVTLPSSLDASSPYAGQCNQDVTISIAGSQVTIPFSAWCDVLNALGYLFLACAYISAAIILGSAV